MNNLIRGEFEQLTPFQQSKALELISWQTANNKGQSVMSDSAYYKIFEWVKRIEEPAPVPQETPEQEESCSDSPQK